MLILSYPVYCNDWRNKRIFQKSLRTIHFDGELLLHLVINGCKYPDFISSLSDRPNTQLVMSPVNSVAGAWARAIQRLHDFGDDAVLLMANQDIFFHRKTLNILYSAAQQDGFVFGDSGKVMNAFSLWGGRLKTFVRFFEKDPDVRCKGLPDELFAPAYFEDNDLLRRMDLSGSKRIAVQAKYRHVGSSVIKYDKNLRKQNKVSHERNKEYYIKKWGGEPGRETFDTPFGNLREN